MSEETKMTSRKPAKPAGKNTSSRSGSGQKNTGRKASAGNRTGGGKQGTNRKTASARSGSSAKNHAGRSGAGKAAPGKSASGKAAEAVKTAGRTSKAAGSAGARGAASRGRRKKAAPAVKIIPLGGLHEIGKNMTALEFEDEIIIVDCGLSFPDDDMFGIDKVIPDFSYLEKNSKKIKGLIITHGHEDHIGGVPYLLKVINVPIYGTRFPLGLIENKLKEHGMKARMHTVKAGQTFKLGKHFSVEALRITHSIADSICLSITTPAGKIFHTGDFKIDYTPVDGDPIDFARLAQIGSEGVLLMGIFSAAAIVVSS